MALTALLVAVILQAPQPPPRDAAAPAQTAAIRGRVLDATTRQPIPGARLTLAAAAGGAADHQALTDLDGRYEFSSLPPGAYVLAASPGDMRATHLARFLDASSPPAAGRTPLPRPFKLRPGETRTGADILLTPARAIEGTVLGETGEPIANAQVTAHTAEGDLAGSARQTDDRGFFRVFGLAPGEYRVCARVDSEAPSPNTDGSRLARTCYPESPDDRGAARVPVSSSDATGITIRMVRSSTYTVTGSVVDAAGAAAVNANVVLSRRTPDGTTYAARVEMQGNAFTARGVLPGEYVLEASIGASADGLISPRERGFMPLAVGSDLSGLVIATGRGGTVRGHVVFEGSPPAHRGLTIQSRQEDVATSSGDGRTAHAAVGPDGSFTLPHLFGPQLLSVQGLPTGWFVKTISQKERDITDTATLFGEHTEGSEVRILVSDRGAQLSARVRDPDGAPADVCTVVLVPVRAMRWSAAIGGLGGFAQNGECRVGNVRPGEYYILAPVPDDLPLLLRSSVLPPEVAARGRKIRVEAGERRTVELQQIRLAQER
jgi:protocatechuate 3,4-dioxygenase beta subunit